MVPNRSSTWQFFLKLKENGGGIHFSQYLKQKEVRDWAVFEVQRYKLEGCGFDSLLSNYE
jgi:hypothetical protein